MNNYPNIQAVELSIGINTVIDPSATIKGVNGKANRVLIGDNCYVGANVQIINDDFVLGDYSKIHHHSNVHGYKPCHIGHNLWMGQYCIIDSIGGVNIGDNCGIGAHSQLWSHIKYGDTLEGCQFLSDKPINIGKDVWFVGHCIVSPITAADKSMALVGSVIVKDMKYNEIYSGVPAKSISDKVGTQFKEISSDVKMKKMQGYLNDFKKKSGLPCKSIRIIMDKNDITDTDLSYFVINDRVYCKQQTTDEIEFMKYLLPAKAKFTPFKIV
tara:strand:+ start:1014 stop:1823 length:810 start_codon:yes stop_codon:yes gene_type:complete